MNAASITKAGGSAVNYTTKRTRLQNALIAEYDSLGAQYSQINSTFAGNGNNTGNLLYFYHPDHLGSSSLITNADGIVTQHVEYVPFGEVFIEERNSTWNTPYLFNAKELDDETGLYYYGARYYDPRTSVWISVDPLAEKYFNVGSYVYCLNNPIKFIDPDGNQVLLGGLVATNGMQRVSAFLINNSDFQDVFIIGSALVAGFTGGEPKQFKVTVNKYGQLSGVILLPATGDDVNVAKSGLLLPVVGGVGVKKTEKLLEKATTGQEAHRQLQREIKIKDPGAEIEVPVQLKDRIVRKDARKSNGKFVIIKPDTKSGHDAARRRENLMKKNGFEVEKMYYDPDNNAFKKGSPTYIGPKNKK